MDYALSVLLLTVLCVFLSSLFFLNVKGSSAVNNGREPKSPACIPIIGDLLWLRRTPVLQLSSALHHASAKLGPIISLNLGLIRIVFVLDRSLAYEALVQRGALFEDHLPHRQSVSDAVITNSNGARCRLLRRNLIQEVFHQQRVRLFRDARGGALDALVRELRSQATTSKDGAVEPRDCFHHAMSHLLAHMCFGERLEDSAVREIEDARNESFRILPDIGFTLLLPKIIIWKRWKKYMEIRRRQVAILIPLILAQREEKHKRFEGYNQRKEPMHSYVHSLLNIEIPDEGGRRLSNDEIAALCTEFLSAGAHTTAFVMEWVMANLVKYPEIQQRLYQEIIQVIGVEKEGCMVLDDDLQKMPFLKAVILETLRIHPPGHFTFPRTMRGDVELGGYRIPKGSVVLFETDLDATAWEDPFDFKPERFIDTSGGKVVSADLTDGKAMKMMPFGAGRRGCPGMSVSMMHLGYYVANLILNFEWRAVDEVDLSSELNVTLVMKHRLRARILPRRRDNGFLPCATV